VFHEYPPPAEKTVQYRKLTPPFNPTTSQENEERMRKAIIAIPLSRGQAKTIVRQQSAQAVGWRFGGGGGGGGGDIGFPALARQQARRTFSNCAVRYSPSNNNDNDKNMGANSMTSSTAQRAMAQSQSPLGRVGVAAALAAAASGKGLVGEPERVKPTLWDEFALRDRVALVSGANRGLGLEMALVLAEAGARAVYCVDLPAQPGEEWRAVAEYVGRMEGGGRRLEYVCADVRDQKAMWKIGEEIGDREGRMDVCVAAAGILKAHTDCLEYPGDEFEEVR
jgi:hypothetical protein